MSMSENEPHRCPILDGDLTPRSSKSGMPIGAHGMRRANRAVISTPATRCEVDADPSLGHTFFQSNFSSQSGMIYLGRSPMKYLTLCLLLGACSHLYGLDAEAIKKIADEPHSRENLVEQLKLYPDAREYKITVRSGKSADDLEAGPEIVATEKTVRGRYIVSQVKFPGTENPMIMVVGYDSKTDTFKKWVLLPNGFVGASSGVADFHKRTIAWISNEEHGEPPVTVVSIETHSDNQSSWKETTLQKGKVMAVSRGVAVKTK